MVNDRCRGGGVVNDRCRGGGVVNDRCRGGGVVNDRCRDQQSSFRAGNQVSFYLQLTGMTLPSMVRRLMVEGSGGARRRNRKHMQKRMRLG